MHRLKSQPIFPEACLTEWGEPFDFPTRISGFPVKMVSTPGLLQVVSILTSDWLNYVGVMPYTGVTSLVAKQVCLGPVKRATCIEFVVELKSFVAECSQ